MELSEAVKTVADLAGCITARADRDPAMPVTVLFRAEDTDYERQCGLYWAVSGIDAVVEHGGILYLVAPDPREASMYKCAPEIAEVATAFDERRQRQRSAMQARVSELEAQLAQAQAELDSHRETTHHY